MKWLRGNERGERKLPLAPCRVNQHPTLFACAAQGEYNGILKILQARLQQYINCELSDVQAGFRKGRGSRDQIANIHWIIEKARGFQKNIYFSFIDYAKAFGKH